MWPVASGPSVEICQAGQSKAVKALQSTDHKPCRGSICLGQTPVELVAAFRLSLLSFLISCLTVISNPHVTDAVWTRLRLYFRSTGMSGDVALIVVPIFLSTFAVILVGARCVVRFGVQKEKGFDDVFVVLASCCSLILTSLCILGKLINICKRSSADKISTGYSQKNGDRTDDLDVDALRKVWIANLTINFALPAIKIAVLLQYLEFFIWPKHRCASWILLVGVAIYGTLAVLTSILTCLPVHLFWTMTDPQQCINIRAFVSVTAVWDLVTNISILALPMMAVVRWAQPKAEKLAFAGLYILGTLAIAACASRLYAVATSDLIAPIRNSLTLWLSTTVELNLIIFCASLPALNVIVDRLCPGFLASWSGPPRRVSHSRAWMKITGRDSPSRPPTELRTSSAQLRRSSTHSATAASVAVSDAPTMASVTTNNRGSAHPGALVVIPEDVEAAGRPMPSRFWARASMLSR